MLKLNFSEVIYFERSAALMSFIGRLADSSEKVMGSALRPCSTFSQCVNMVDRPTRLRNTWFGFLAFVIF